MLNIINETSFIFVVDDIPKNLQVVGSLLKKKGYRIAFAKDGEQALNYIADNQPDLILLDIMMPGIDGYEVCRRLKEDPKTKDIPIIFLTAMGDEEDEYRGLQMGGVDYITKPFNPKILEVRVKNQLQLQRKTKLLEKMVHIDGLAEIYNRRHFDDILEREWKRAKRDLLHLSLVLIDIDFFKKYNDTYGHASGDDCLRKVAQALYKTPQRSNDLVARYGGEEFAAILPDTKTNDAEEIAQKMRQNIESLNIPHEQNNAADHVTISVGVTTIIPNENYSPTSLIEAADKCLYEAKEGGRNQVKCQLIKT